MGTATVAKADEIAVSAVNAEAPRFRREKIAALLTHLGATNFGFGGRETLCTGGRLLLARAYCFGREVRTASLVRRRFPSDRRRGRTGSLAGSNRRSRA